MKKPFSVGDRARMKNLNIFTEYEGTECRIIEPIGWRTIINTETMKKEFVICYIVMCYDGRRLAARVFQLEPPLPPATPTVVREIEEVL